MFLRDIYYKFIIPDIFFHSKAVIMMQYGRVS